MKADALLRDVTDEIADVEGRVALTVQIEIDQRQASVTDDELMVAIHKQGILELTDVQRAVLETDGNISVFARTPTTDERRQAELAEQLTRIEATLARLASSLPATAPA